MINYKKFKIKRMNPIIYSFCAAKWMTADFWLETGTTSSCHLPPPHKFDIEAIQQNLNLIHNTDEKLAQKQMMLNGKQPSGCSNCWNVENINKDAMTERVHQSYILRHHNFSKFTLDVNHIPEKITVSFDSLCNFTCSYCDATQSSSWATDLKINGPYKRIKGDDRNTYIRLGKKDKLTQEEYELVFDKFTQFIITNIKQIKSIRCLGGEPLVSRNFWKFLETIKSVKDHNQIELIIVTNLSEIGNVKKLIESTKSFKNIIIEASTENIEQRAEFLRKGLKWNIFQKNIDYLSANNIELRILGTISGLALDGLVQFLEWLRKYKNIRLDSFILRHPTFQAIQVLPNHLKVKYKKELSGWLLNNNEDMYKVSIHLEEKVKNLVTILKDECTIYNNVDINVLRTSNKEFYKQYAKRHQFEIDKIFSQPMAEWLLNED